MAWIKMRTDLIGDPRVIQISRLLGIDEVTVIGHLYAFWSWADSHIVADGSSDGHAIGVTPEWLDAHLRCPGFSQAMLDVEWVTFKSGGGITIPDFDVHMSDSAKTRSLASERKRRQRAGVTVMSRSKRDKSVTAPSRSKCDKSVTREEESREDNTNPPLIPPQSGGVNVPAAFDEWWAAYPKKVGKQTAIRAWRRIKGKPPIKAMLEKLAEQIESEEWTKEGGMYILNPTRYLNHRRWEDEVPTYVKPTNPYEGIKWETTI